jgi:hypothetical protein
MKQCKVDLKVLSKIQSKYRWHIFSYDLNKDPDLQSNIFSTTKAIQYDSFKLGSSIGKMTSSIGPPDGYIEYCVSSQNIKIDSNTHCVKL